MKRAATLAFVFAIACAGQQRQGADKEATLGRELLAEVERQYKPVADPVVISYLNELARKLADVPVTVEVLDTGERRAGTLPGGYLVLSSGMILGMGSVREMASVLAHQIAHLVERHGRMRGGQMPITYIGTGWGVCSRYNPDAKVLIPLSLRSEMRGWEDEADALARGYVDRAQLPADQSRFEEIKARLPQTPSSNAPSLKRPRG